MLVLKGQQIRFIGRDGEKRAATFAAELNGRAEAKGNVVTITARELELGARLWPHRLAADLPPTNSREFATTERPG